jgi:hypothetical protein
MVEFMPYFAGLITLLFSIAFSYAVSDGWKYEKNDKK